MQTPSSPDRRCCALASQHKPAGFRLLSLANGVGLQTTPHGQRQHCLLPRMVADQSVVEQLIITGPGDHPAASCAGLMRNETGVTLPVDTSAQH